MSTFGSLLTKRGSDATKIGSVCIDFCIYPGSWILVDGLIQVLTLRFLLYCNKVVTEELKDKNST